ncbi:MAG: hypothetical protein K2I06_14090 [Ruminococcus sp.]|nr:hypothetical protein [Ruminococcus sp.]
MTVGEFAQVFDKKTGFIAVIDSAKDWSTDAVVIRDVSSVIESEMIIDRIAYFNAPVFMIQLEKHIQCSQEASDVIVVFAHKKGKTPVNIKLKMEICNVFEESKRLTVMSEGYL